MIGQLLRTTADDAVTRVSLLQNGNAPLLWRFHSIHHSCEHLDWLAFSRLHLVDILLTRAVAFVPLYVMGFSQKALYGYLVFASIQGILIHSNLRFDFGVLRHLLVTPQFHHWHHTAQREALDRNFAIHLPLFDWLFGQFFFVQEWFSILGGKDEMQVDLS